ncbi:MAG TPA: growth inhibitor PemK [Desulfobacteraceae bacterium]|nr:growth inhibitor PemK [Desulfobacteraceae bacterium]
MGKFIKGDVVVAPFPFSDLSSAKKRPVVVIAALDGEDVLVCQITSKSITDNYAVPLTDNDFSTGGLRQVSNIRPNRLFTADGNIILYRAGVLRADKMQEVVEKIIQIVRA